MGALLHSISDTNDPMPKHPACAGGTAFLRAKLMQLGRKIRLMLATVFSIIAGCFFAVAGPVPPCVGRAAIVEPAYGSPCAGPEVGILQQASQVIGV